MTKRNSRGPETDTLGEEPKICLLLEHKTNWYQSRICFKIRIYMLKNQIQNSDKKFPRRKKLRRVEIS